MANAGMQSSMQLFTRKLTVLADRYLKAYLILMLTYVYALKD